MSVNRGRRTVLVLGGGPDAEREVSLISARCVADALEKSGRFAVERRTVDRVGPDELERMPGDVVFPVLHGGWGEGGPLQDVLEWDGRPFVGSLSAPARYAMDKIATKFAAAKIGIPTTRAFILDPRDPVCPLHLPAVIKPVHEGSTIGLYLCRTDEEWARARRTIEEAALGAERRSYMIEPLIESEPGRSGRELTVGLLDGKALPVIEIRPADGLYDYEAKYTRDDTKYVLEPDLPGGVEAQIKSHTELLAGAVGARHLARADFMLGSDGTPWFLEINTMPGFTDHSLVPMAARHAGLGMPELCASLVEMALRDHATVHADGRAR